MSSNYLEELFGLTGQTAVVIGGAGVLGGAPVRGLAQAGAHVVVADLTEDGCQARVADCKKLGGKASYCTVNVTSARVDRKPAGRHPEADRPGRHPRQFAPA